MKKRLLTSAHEYFFNRTTTCYFMCVKIIFGNFIFLTLMVDDKEVVSEEDIVQKENEGPNRLQNHKFSMHNKNSPQCTSNSNTFKGTTVNSIMSNKEQYLELERNVASENQNTVQERTGGKIANYNRSSGMIENVSINPYHCNLSSNQGNTNRLNAASPRLQQFQGM